MVTPTSRPSAALNWSAGSHAIPLNYWLVSELTFEMALDYELAHRRENVDSRRLLFEKHLELLARANPEWSLAKRTEYDAVLALHPFQDART